MIQGATEGPRGYGGRADTLAREIGDPEVGLREKFEMGEIIIDLETQKCQGKYPHMVKNNFDQE